VREVVIMSSNFWKFASTLEKEFSVPYDRDSEVVACPECHEFIEGNKWKFEDFTSYDPDGYVVYTCPLCGCVLTCRPIEV